MGSEPLSERPHEEGGDDRANAEGDVEQEANEDTEPVGNYPTIFKW